MSSGVKHPAICIFDLDGTLVDSLRDIAEACNQCLDLLGLAARPIGEYRYLVGEGVPTLCERAVGGSHPHLVGRLIELVRPRYRSRPLVYTKPFAGIQTVLQKLASLRIRLAVLSNKPHDLTVRVVREFWPNTFDLIQGYVREETRKPQPDHVFEICRELGASPEQTWLIGDTPTDIETSRRAGCHAIGVTWGFRTRADLEQSGAKTIIDHPDQIVEQLESIRKQPA